MEKNRGDQPQGAKREATKKMVRSVMRHIGGRGFLPLFLLLLSPLVLSGAVAPRMAVEVQGDEVPSESKRKAQIRGTLKDGETGDAIIGAAVRLLGAKDSLLIKGTTSNTQGTFTLSDLEAGQYQLQITYVSYKTHTQSVTLRAGQQLRLREIVLQPDAQLIGEVTVTGQASSVTVKPDTIQFNSDAFRLRQGATVEELLRRIPGMEVSDEGQISYNGEAIERIELDGRNFFSGDPTMATRNLPSDMIKNVQVVDKKSDETRLTGMDNGEKIKVLNLVVKEEKKGGLIVNANAGYGTRGRYKADALLNLFSGDARYTLLGNLNNIDGVRRGRGDQVARRIGGNYDQKWGNKLHITAETFYSDNDDHRTGDQRVEQLLGSGRSNLQEEQYSNFGNNKQWGLNGRMEWTPWGEQTMILLEPDISYRRSSQQNASQYETHDEGATLINKGSSRDSSRSDQWDASGVLHFRHTFNEAGRNIYSRLWGGWEQTSGEGLQQSETLFGKVGRSEELDQQNRTENRSYRLGAHVAYLEPLTKQWALQLNYRIDLQERDNDRQAFNKDAEGAYTLLDEAYSRGTYNRNINQRLGLQLRYSFGKRNSLSVGFNANPTYTHTITSQGLVENFNRERTVWNYAPQVMLDFRPTDALFLFLRYNGRSDHPSMTQLNPATIQVSPLSRTTGNPDLLPSFVHRIRMHASFNRPKERQSFNVMGSYSYTKNAVIAAQRIDRESGKRETTYQNVDGNQMVWLGFMANVPIGGANSPWSSATFGNIMMSRNHTFVNEALNRSHLMAPRLSERISWRGKEWQVTAGVHGSMQRVDNSLSRELNRQTLDYSAFGEVVWTSPLGLSLTSRLSYQDAYGYDDGVKRDFWLLDASLSYAFLKGKRATIELSGYDLLQQRTSLTRRITESAITDTRVNGVMSYAMLTFSYRFNNMGGGGSAGAPSRMMPGGHRRGGGFRR